MLESVSLLLEVTVNSGGMVFFALFDNYHGNGSKAVEGVAVVKISSSRMATQSERLGYEFAKHLGVLTPQAHPIMQVPYSLSELFPTWQKCICIPTSARVIHNSSSEWQSIKDATEKARSMPRAGGDDVSRTTCTELLEALELSRCLLLIGISAIFTNGASVH
eukprot:Gb_03644 [translate_table: standard]